MLKQQLQKYLEMQPLARERKNKDRGIVNVLLNKYPELLFIEKESLVKFVKDYNSMDRSWRQILSETPSLRGSDYNDKDLLEEEKLVELGYKTKL